MTVSTVLLFRFLNSSKQGMFTTQNKCVGVVVYAKTRAARPYPYNFDLKPVPMKSFLSILFLAASFFVSCSDEPTIHTVEFHVQTEFDDDLVEIYIDDGQVVLNQKVTTSMALGVDLSAIKSVDMSTGEHAVRIVVNGTHELKTLIRVESDLFVAVTYDPQNNEVSIAESVTRYLYM